MILAIRAFRATIFAFNDAIEVESDDKSLDAAIVMSLVTPSANAETVDTSLGTTLIVATPDAAGAP